MARVTFVEQGGAEHVVEAAAGSSLMEAARDNGVPGILADCGGACACATCHVYVPEEWRRHTGEPDGMEADMLEAADGVRAASRLACQIRVTPDLEGLIVEIPGASYLA
jgi:ferredoxin, 2Fe-2S